MKIILEIEDLRDWEILLPLLKRLHIKVIDKAMVEQKKANTKPLNSKDDILKFAGILSNEEAAGFENAVIESRQIDFNEW